MKFQVRYLDSLDLTIVHVLEMFRLDEMQAFVERTFKTNVRKNAIWEMNRGVLHNLSIDDFKALAHMHLPLLQKRQNGNVFFVVHGASQGRLMQWYQAYVGQLQDLPLAFHQCDSVNEAIRCLQDMKR